MDDTISADLSKKRKNRACSKIVVFAQRVVKIGLGTTRNTKTNIVQEIDDFRYTIAIFKKIDEFHNAIVNL